MLVRSLSDVETLLEETTGKCGEYEELEKHLMEATKQFDKVLGSDDDSLSFGWGVASSSEQSGMASDTSSEVGTPSPSVRSAPIGIPKRSARLAQLHDSA